MSNADKPWSGSTAASSSSNSDSGTSDTLTSSKAPMSGLAPGAGGSSVDDARAVFNKMCREIEEREKAAGQQPEQGAPQGVPAWLLEPKPMAPNGDHPHQVAEFDAKKHLDEVFESKREQWAHYHQYWAHWEATHRPPPPPTKDDIELGMLRAAPDIDAKKHSMDIYLADGRKHEQDQKGWEAFHRQEERGEQQLDRTETAGERQQETEERRRSSGMSL